MTSTTAASSARRAHRRFENKVVLITGAGGGQGRTAAVRFAEEGAVVVGADIKTEGHTETVAMVEAAGGTMTGSGSLDLTVAGDVRDWVAAAAATHGGIDVVYNNAGVFRMGDKRESSSRLWPSGVRIMAISTRWSPSPVTRPAHAPSTMARPSSWRPSSRRTRSSRRGPPTMPTLSIR
jgi:hypothetical protein